MKRWVISCAAGWIVLITSAFVLYNFAQNFTPKIDVPEIIAVRSDIDGTVIVEWGAVNYATSYRIFRRTNGLEWKLLKVVSSSTFSYTDADVAGSCEYTLRACNGTMGHINLSDYSTPVTYTP